MKSKSWDAIENHFLELIDNGFNHERFVELIRHIRSSGFSQRIYGVTSLDKLLLSPSEEIEFNKDTLHITFDKQNEEWSFEYYSIPYKQPEFTRRYPANKATEKLDNFIKMIGW